MFNKKILAMIIAGCSTSAMAENLDELIYPQAFIGVKGGYQWTEDPTFTGEKPNDKIFGASAGLKFSENWSWDIGYQYHYPLNGKFHNAVQNTDSIVTIETQLIETNLRYDWHLSQNISLYGSVGAAYWELDKTHPFSLPQSDKGFSPKGGLGVSMNLSPRVDLSAGYQYIDTIGGKNTGSYNSHAAVLDLTYTFTRKKSAQDFNSNENQSIVSQLDNAQTDITDLANTNFGQDYSFEINGSEVVSPLTQELEKAAAILNAQPQAIVNIVGHTDSTGSEAYNQKLSVLRAEKAAQYLESLGVSSKQIVISGEGELNPIDTNSTVEGRAKNRRVDVTISNSTVQTKEV